MTFRRKLISGISLALAAGLTLSACSTTTAETATEGEAAPERGEVSKILFDYPFTALPVYSAIVPIIEQRAEELGVTVEFTNDDMDLSKQVTNLTTYLSSDVDAVVSFPMDPASLESIAQQYRDAGKYWVTYGGDMENQDATLQFSFYDSGYQLGVDAAEWALENVGEDAKVFVLEDLTIQIGQERTQGILDGLKETAPELEIVSQQQAVTPDEGLTVTSAVLSQHPDVNVVVAAVGDAAQGAYQALVASGRSETDPETYVGGLDPSLFGFERIKEGTIYRAATWFDLFELVTYVIDIPVNLGKGEKDASVDLPVELVRSGDPKIDDYITALGG